MLFTFEGGRIS